MLFMIVILILMLLAWTYLLKQKTKKLLKNYVIKYWFKFIITLIILIIVIVLSVVYYMYINGGKYDPSKSSMCFKDNTFSIYNDSPFCDIKVIKLVLDDNLKSKLHELAESSYAKRVNLAGWKAGKTVTTSVLLEKCPEVFEKYKELEGYVSSIIGEKVQGTRLSLETTCKILVYDNEGDFINWHYDVNYYKGRFFTLLMPISEDNTCTTYMFKNNKGSNESVRLEKNTALLFEGERVFHMASKLCKNEKRFVLSMHFTTNNDYKKDGALINIKELAYSGI